MVNSLGPRPPKLTPEERQKAIDAPGPSWKEWAYETGLKPWYGLLLLILDTFVIGTFLEGPSLAWKWAAVVAIVPLGYADYVAWAFLWAKLPTDPTLRRDFHPTWKHPFAVGRLRPDYGPWKSGALRPKDDGEIPPEEFL